MSIKDLFQKEKFNQVLGKSELQQVADEVESPGYLDEYSQKRAEFVPVIDFSDPANFARYGSAERYYDDSISRVHKQYPYDGSLREKIKWENESLLIDKYVFDNLYPRTNGYVNMGESYTSLTATDQSYSTDGVNEWILFKGGPHASTVRGTTTLTGDYKATSSLNSPPNVYKANVNRESNLQMSTSGSTVEFWLKNTWPVAASPKQVIFDLWNSGSWGAASTGAPGYGRFRVEIRHSGMSAQDKFFVEFMSGSETGVVRSGAYSTTTNDPCVPLGSGVPIASSAWHHYAISVANTGSSMRLRLYVDGQLNEEIVTGSAISEVTGAMVAQVGALIRPVSGSVAARGYGKLSGSLDEFRYWNTERTAQEIGRYWRRQVGGGTNSDNSKYKYVSASAEDTKLVDLGVYYKFNEGITLTSSIDSVVLDYSGRLTNGEWPGYTSDSRNVGSAIVSASAAPQEFKDPIIYSFHPEVVALTDTQKKIGKEYDYRNNSSIYHSLPAWMIEDLGNDPNLNQLIQIMSSYFDELQSMMEALPKLKDPDYISGSVTLSNKPNVLASNLLDSVGFKSSEMFVDADIIEKFAAMSDEKIFEEELYDVKNAIYQNVYNNILAIYKSKGTIKSLRNLFRCFGVDEELIKIKTLADNLTYTVDDNYYETARKKKFINFNSSSATTQAVIYQHTASTLDLTSGSAFLSSSYTAGGAAPGGVQQEDNGLAITFESDVLLPQKLGISSPANFSYGHLTSSIFGVHLADPEDSANTTWPEAEEFFEVYSVRDKRGSTGAKFYLSSSLLRGDSLTSSFYSDIYDNSNWNLSVRLYPTKYPMETADHRITDPGGTSTPYTLHFFGVRNIGDYVLDEFSLTASITSDYGLNFMTSSKRPYVGASRTNFTGTIRFPSDIKAGAVRVWTDYISDASLRAHAIDRDNFGVESPINNTFVFQTGSNSPSGSLSMFIPRVETLALNWDFSTVTASNGAGNFVVQDLTSGSVEAAKRYGWLGNVVEKQNTGVGNNFPASETGFVSLEFLEDAKKQLPEVLYGNDMVSVLSFDDNAFTRDSRPVKFHTSIEKNMYQSISEEMLNFFSTIKDYGALIGRTEERYRQDYKSLGYLRRLFFDKVGNTPDLERFIEYYKWLDSALSQMIMDVIPASANIDQGLKTVIESHIFERNKIWNKFPTLEQFNEVEPELLTNVSAVQQPPPMPGPAPNPTVEAPEGQAAEEWSEYTPPLMTKADGTGEVDSDQDRNIPYWKNRAPRTEGPASTGNSSVDEVREKILKVRRGPRRARSPVRMSAKIETPPIAGGNNKGADVKGVKVTNQVSNENTKTQAVIKQSNVKTEAKTAISALLPSPLKKQKPQVIVTQTNTAGADLTVQEEKKEENNTKIGETPITITVSHTSSGEVTDASVGNGGYMMASINLDEDGDDASMQDYVDGTSVSGNVDFGGFHVDACNEELVVPLQSVFTERFVGGYPYRHVALNVADSKKKPNTVNNLDDRNNRPEGFFIFLSGSQIKISSVMSASMHYPRGNRIRGPGVKSLVNVKNLPYYAHTSSGPISGNINFGLPNRTMGTFSRNYELIMTTGRNINNLWFVSGSDGNGGFTNQYPEVFFLTGNLNFTLPDYSIGQNKTVIAERFSAPGSKDTLSRGYLDPASETFSVYNNLNYRNNVGRGSPAHWDKPSLNVSASMHAGKFGLLSGTAIPSLTYGGTASYYKVNRNPIRRIKIYGTDYIPPIGDVITTASQFDNWFVNHQIPQSDRQYNWITASMFDINSAPYGFAVPQGYISSSQGEISQFTFVSASQALADNIPVNFVGLNTLVLSTLNTASNTITNTLNTNLASLSSDYRENAFNLHRNGTYGFVSWTQIRGRDNPLVRNMVNNNKISVFSARNDFFAQSNYRWSSNPATIRISHGTSHHVRATSSYVEGPVISRFRPLTHTVATKDYNNNKQVNVLINTYGNNLGKFAHIDLNNTLGTEQIQPPQFYDEMLELYGDKDLGKNNPVTQLDSLNYAEVVYPKSTNAYLKKVRGRENYTEVAGTGSNGYDRQSHRTFWRSSDAARDRTAGEAINSQNQIITAGDKNRCKFLSVWPADTGYIDSGYAANPRYQAFTSVDTSLLTGAVGELVHAPYVIPNSNLYGMHLTASICMYRVSMGLPVSASLNTAVPQYVTTLIAGKSPWFDSYEDYSEDIRSLAKNFTVLPEFVMSDHMNFYLNDSSASFTSTNNKLLTLEGGTYTSSAEGQFADFNEGFFNTYAHSDFLKYFDVIQEEHEDKEIAKTSRLSFKCSGVKKLLPYNGFYPQTRAIQLGTLLSQSLMPYIVGGSTEYGPGTTLPRISYPERMNSLARPFMAPGIFFNSIKSGIAVDWVTFTAAPTISSHDASGGHLQHGYNSYSDTNRLPFELLVDVNKHLPATIDNSAATAPGSTTAPKVYYGEPSATGSNPYVEWGFKKKNNFELAMHNFLGETVKFFLKDGQLTNFYSAQESQFKTMVSGTTYAMKVTLFKTDEMVLSQGGRSSVSVGGHAGSLFGPPFSSSYYAAGVGGGAFVGTNPYSTLAYAAYTPPYFYGQSFATIEFTPSETKKYTLKEIFAGSSVTYSNINAGLSLNDAASSGSMPLSASMNLFGSTRVKKVNYSTGLGPSGDYLPLSFQTSEDSAFDVWSIGTKWECPVVNFYPEDTETDGYNRLLTNGTGIWRGYGRLLNEEDEGIFTGVSDVDGVESLIDVVGFKQTKTRIGKLAEKKKISEAIVAIPFVDDPQLTDLETVEYIGKSFIKIDNQMYDYQVKTKKESGIAVKAGGKFGVDYDIDQTSITDMYEKMQKYVIPPQLDFTDADLDKDPFVMYMFEFDHDLSMQDLSDIWQGLMPEISTKAEKQEVVLSHETNELEFFGGNPLPNNLRWLVFKVKRRAENNYYNVTADSKDDDRFKFLFKTSEKEIKHSYNWPYDFFSLVELGEIEAEVEIKGITPTDPGASGGDE